MGSDLELWEPELNSGLMGHVLSYISLLAHVPCRLLHVSHMPVAEKPQSTTRYVIQLRQSAIELDPNTAVCRSGP